MVGTRKSDAGGIEPEDNFEFLARNELQKLSRQLRLMSNDNRSYLKESNSTINQQVKTINSLTQEKKEVEGELKHIVSFNDKKQSIRYVQIAQLTSTYTKLCKNLEYENQFAKKFMLNLNQALERVDELRLCTKEKEKVESPILHIQHRIAIAKRKLETITGKFDLVVAENAQSRLSVDETLHENVDILVKCAQLEHEVEKLKEKTADLVDHATFAYEQREEAVGKMMAIIEKNAKEKKQNSLEMSELARMNRHDKKLLNFMSTKNRERLFLETSEDRITRLELVKEKVADEALESYIDNFNQLLKNSTAKVSDLVTEYEELYRANIKKFEYINQLEKEVETLQKTLGHFRTKIRCCTLEIVERNQIKNKVILTLMTNLEDIVNEFKKVQKQLDVMELSMQNVFTSATNLFQITLTSDNTHVLRLLGSDNGISSENLILYINIIEERVDQLLQRRKSIDLDSSRSPRPTSRTGSVFSTVTLAPSPPLFQVSANDKPCHYEILDTEVGPVTYAKLREKVRVASVGSLSSDSEESCATVRL